MAISSNLHLTQSRLSTDHPARIYVDHAALATQRGTKLTAQLLAFSRTQRLDLKPVELDVTAQHARDLIGSALGPKISIELDLRAPNTWILVDEDQLHLAILNLALNARDAMPAGGTFIVQTYTEAPQRSDLKCPSFATIRLCDTGEGMTTDVVDRAIEPFFTTKERGKGTGLGLAQVFGVVKQCGGDLRIQSEPGSGTIIELLLPLTVASDKVGNQSKQQKKLSTLAALSNGPLLVIDDDEHVRVALAEMFRSAGYNVTEAENGQVGLSLLEALNPALAVIDFIMPGLNGAEVARLARAKLPSLPIIFVSGFADTLALDEIGNAVILRKPVGPQALLEAVDNALRIA